MIYFIKFDVFKLDFASSNHWLINFYRNYINKSNIKIELRENIYCTVIFHFIAK